MSKVIVRLLIPAATLIAEKNELKCRPSELPIYSPDSPQEVTSTTKTVREPGAIEKQIGVIRREITSLTKQAKELQYTVENLYHDGKAQCTWLIEYLQEEDNTVPRAGAIAIGGMAGFILGLRGGFFRRLLFTSTGALGMAAICYPNEAAEYSEIAGKEAKRYINIAYNFYRGAKKDDPPLELPSFPKIPTSPSELWALVGGSKTQSDIVSDAAVKDEKQNETKDQPATKS
ncbi:Apolipoprotein O [Popillia japonica]|uniref:MICOS complex subunit n=1 Tax=Popillia japonica TaxID=7064 RepID=A0AAW1IBI8_POPJA